MGGWQQGRQGRQAPHSTWSGPLTSAGLLGAVLLAALALRLHGLGFGLPAALDPDELIFELGGLRMLRTGTLNPGWFGHPAATTMDALALIDAGVLGWGMMVGWFHHSRDFATAVFADPGLILLPGRVLIAVSGVACVALTARLGKELAGARAGIAAAALLAVNPVHVHWSQVIRADIMGTAFMLLCMSAALRIARTGLWRHYVWAALWLAAAAASKWPLAIAAASVIGASVLRVARHPEQRWGVARRLAGFGALALAFLPLISPYLLLARTTVLHDMQAEGQVHHLGATGGTPWANAWFYLSGPIAGGFGPLGVVLGLAGVVMIARRADARAVLLPPALLCFVLLCAQRLIWERWALPLLPLLAIPAGIALAWLADGSALRLAGTKGRAIAVLLALAAIGPPAWQSVAQADARMNDTRTRASAWAVAHIPPGSTIFVEHFAFDFYDKPYRMLFPMGTAGCLDARGVLRGQISIGGVSAIRGGQAVIDWGTLSPAARAACPLDYAILSQMDRYAAERQFFPQEYAAYRDLLSRSRVIATFSPDPGHSAGPRVVIAQVLRRQGTSQVAIGN